MADVHAKQAAEQNKNANPLNEDGAENIETNDVSTACYVQVSQPKMLKEAISFRHLLEHDGLHMTKAGKYYKCLCPFHGERTASFVVGQLDDYATCYGCGWKGDIFNYIMDRDEVGFKNALKTLTNFRQRASAVQRRTRLQKTLLPGEEDVLSREQRSIIAAAPERLIDEQDLRERIVAPRGWKEQTILKLAAEGSLGWNQSALAFIYSTGLKLRNWPYHEFKWEFGHQSLWRVHKLAGATHVYLTEGETDAISLVDAGFENTPGVAVICVPGAIAFQESWAPLFAGKTVTLCFDNDTAGETATDKVAALLEPYATQLLQFNPKEAE